MTDAIKLLKQQDIVDRANYYVNINNKINILKNEIITLKSGLNGAKYNLLQRKIFSRKKYLKQQEDISLIQEKEKQLEQLSKDFDRDEYQKLKLEFDKYKASTTLKEMGISFAEAMDFLEENNKPLILNESDKVITDNESNFDKKDDYILVHKTKYMPTSDTLQSTASKHVVQKEVVKMKTGDFVFNFNESRDTVHFCLNGEVESHNYGDFDGRKYAVIIPFNRIDDANLKSFDPVDTYFQDAVDLKNGYILCPENEIEQMKTSNPHTTVVGYKGKSVDGYANALVSMLGYRVESCHQDAWGSYDDEAKAVAFAKQNNYEQVTHIYSYLHIEESLRRKSNIFLGFIAGFNDYISENPNVNIDSFLNEYYDNNNPRYMISNDEIMELHSPKKISLSEIASESQYRYLGEKDVYINSVAEHDNFFHYNVSAAKANLKTLFNNLAVKYNVQVDEKYLDLLCGDLSNKDFISKYITESELNNIVSEKNMQDYKFDNEHINKEMVDEFILKKIMHDVYDKSLSLQQSERVR